MRPPVIMKELMVMNMFCSINSMISFDVASRIAHSQHIIARKIMPWPETPPED